LRMLEKAETLNFGLPERMVCSLRGIIMHTLAKSDILKLSVPERIQLVEDIWDSIAHAPEGVDLSEAQRIELDKRLDAYYQDPGQGLPWEVIRERVRSMK